MDCDGISLGKINRSVVESSSGSGGSDSADGRIAASDPVHVPRNARARAEAKRCAKRLRLTEPDGRSRRRE